MWVIGLKKKQGRDWSENDVDEMFDLFRQNIPIVAVTEDLIRPIDGVKECIDKLREAGILVGCDTGYPKEACDAIYKILADKHGINSTWSPIPRSSREGHRRSWSTTA